MQIITINGNDYVGARCLENEYRLTRKKCWQLLQDSGLQHVGFSQSYLYPYTEVVSYFDERLK